MKLPDALKASLTGSLEIFVLMPSAADRFENTRAAALRSFFVPLLVAVYITAITYHINGPPAYIIQSYVWLTCWTIFCGALKLTIFLGLARSLLKIFDASDVWYQFVNANNWLMLPAALALTPPWLMLFMGQTLDTAMSFLLASVFYALLMLCFLTRYMLRIEWLQTFAFPMACLIANGAVSILFGKFLAGMFIF